MILIIDNYDSFVYNLARYVSELGFSPKVVRNDSITIADISNMAPSQIIISPGAGGPSDTGISLELIPYFAKRIPILGVCLGHQAIGQVYGAKIVRAKTPMHGKSAMVFHERTGLFKDIANPLKVGRYHSLIIDKDSLPEELVVTAQSKEGEIMALAHQKYPTYGVQFHPESIITQEGHKLLNNFLTKMTMSLP